MNSQSQLIEAGVVEGVAWNLYAQTERPVIMNTLQAGNKLTNGNVLIDMRFLSQKLGVPVPGPRHPEPTPASYMERAKAIADTDVEKWFAALTQEARQALQGAVIPELNTEERRQVSERPVKAAARSR